MMSGLKFRLMASSFIRCLKWPLCAEAVGYSLIMSLPGVRALTSFIFFSYISLGRLISSSTLTLRRFASIRSAIFSSAISMVMYNTFLPSIILPAAKWHMARDLPTPVPARIIFRDLRGRPPLVILLRYSRSNGTRSSFVW